MIEWEMRETGTRSELITDNNPSERVKTNRHATHHYLHFSICLPNLKQEEIMKTIQHG